MAKDDPSSNSISTLPLSTRWTDPVIVALAAFTLRAALIAIYPFVYGGDPIIRLIESDRLLISYQLPGLQAVIVFVHAIGGGVVGSRLAVAAISALAAAGLCQLMATRWSRSVAILGGLTFACSPFLVYYSTVPYQFPLVLAAVHWGLYFYLHPGGPVRLAICSVCFGVACLTRYEAWIFTACLACVWVWQRVRQNCSAKSSPASRSSAARHSAQQPAGAAGLRGWVHTAVAAVALFGWAPAVWLVGHGGISPTGTFVVGTIQDWGQVLRPFTTAGMLLGLSGPPLVMLCVAGVVPVYRECVVSRRRAWWLFVAAWLVCSSVALVFSAHPVDPPSPRLNTVLASVRIDATAAMFVTPREGHLYASLLSIMAALSLAWIGGYHSAQRVANGKLACRRPARWRTLRSAAAVLISALVLGYCVWMAAERIQRAGAEPVLRTAVAAARVVDALLEGGGRALVLAKPIPPAAIADYIQRARRAGGAEGERRAKEILASINTGPPAYQRMLVHSQYDRGRLLDLADVVAQTDDVVQALPTRDVRYCVLFNDFAPDSAAERSAAGAAKAGRLVATIDIGVGARVYALPPRME